MYHKDSVIKLFIKKHHITHLHSTTGPEVINLFSCPTQMSMKVRLVETQIEKQTFIAFKLSDVVFIMLIDVKIPTVQLSMSCITSGTVPLTSNKETNNHHDNK